MQDKLIEALENHGITNYQIFDQVMALPMLGNPRFDNAVWPGYNISIVMQFTDDEFAQQTMQKLKHMNTLANNKSEYIEACLLPMDDYFFD